MSNKRRRDPSPCKKQEAVKRKSSRKVKQVYLLPITKQNEHMDFKSNGPNFVKVFSEMQRGSCLSTAVDRFAENLFAYKLKWFKLFAAHVSPSLRITAMQWHPRIPNVMVIGAKDGALTLLTNDDIQNAAEALPGSGPGGTIEHIQFTTNRSELEVCTASVDGTVSLYNFDHHLKHVLCDTDRPESNWYCTVAVHQDGKMVFGGDNKGNVSVHHLDSGKTTPQTSLHKAKLRHIEFNSRDPNLLVSASLDKTVKLWDIRKMKGRQSFTECLEHDSPVCSAKFSKTDGCRLLTTDQDSQLRIYKAPTWCLEHKITHPHRLFQHITPIRASWHPRADLFVIGRYPDPKISNYDPKMRSVDIFSASSGAVCHELMDASALITSLVDFNCTGFRLASTSGRNLYLWKSGEPTL